MVSNCFTNEYLNLRFFCPSVCPTRRNSLQKSPIYSQPMKGLRRNRRYYENL